MATIAAAEELEAPIIINLLQEHLQMHIDCEILTGPIIQMAKNSRVEVAINLDHGQDVDHLKRCIAAGFSSVMADFSMFPIEDNITRTKEIVAYAHARGVSVEAEVGNMGAARADGWTSQEMFTHPDEGIRLIKETGVDCLAVSYGSSHGDYPEGYLPNFDYSIVSTIHEATQTPLVLHGGSGAGQEAIRRSVALGIAKINVGSDFMKGQLSYLEENLAHAKDYPLLIHQTIAAGKEVVKRYIQLAGSANKSVIKKEEEYVTEYESTLITR